MTESLPTLATVDDLTARLGRPLTPAEASRAGALLWDASWEIRRFCRKDFMYHAGDEKILREDGGEIRLPYRPVDRLNSVIAKSGRPDVPDIPVTWYVFDGIDRVKIMDATASGVINLPEAWYMYGTFPGTFLVNYDHGYYPVRPFPPEVVGVCANVVLSVLLAPTMASGVIGETVGPYSYRVVRSGGGVAVALTQNDEKKLDDFRDKVNSVKIGGWQ